MADQIDQRKVKWIEYVDEATLGTTPNNPTMKAFPGELIDFEIDGGAEFDTYKIMKGPTDSDPLSCGVTRKTVEKEHTVKVTLKVTGMDLIPYVVMGSTTSTYTPGTTPHPVSIGAMIGTEFCVVKGCILTNHEVNFKDRKSVGELTLEFMGMERTDWGSDYIGTSSHASAVSEAPMQLGDVTSILYDTAAMSAIGGIVDSLKFGVKNNIEAVRDGSASWASKISSWNYTAGRSPSTWAAHSRPCICQMRSSPETMTTHWRSPLMGKRIL
ncbi:hypothetical protein [Methanosarcina horonobensis]|uniref:hypothetical protein n=1 Tax=Methanosarcina horonobensis TaxID=418008 RepID=UPI000AD31864|nr:hypothetical protein [Methanosarcina horonobensis]